MSRRGARAAPAAASAFRTVASMPGIVGRCTVHALRRGRSCPGRCSRAPTTTAISTPALAAPRRSRLRCVRRVCRVDAVARARPSAPRRRASGGRGERRAAPARPAARPSRAVSRSAERANRSNSSTSAPSAARALAHGPRRVVDPGLLRQHLRGEEALAEHASTIFSRACSGFESTSSELAKISRSAVTTPRARPRG